MLISIEIDDKLMADALRLSGSNNCEDVIEQALKLLVQMVQQQQIRQFRGELNWEDDVIK